MWSLFSRDPSRDFGYEINDVVHADDRSIWILHKGKKKATSELVSIFRFELKSPGESSYMELARNTLKRLKTLRHPSILTYIDSLETDKYILIVTEYVEPLQFFINKMSSWSDQQKDFAISWGILSVAKGLCFLNNDCKLVHGNLSLSSIFINNSSDWKIFNLEYVINVGGSIPNKSFFPHKIYTAPEATEGHGTSDKSIDSWGLGCLIWEIFNGPLSDVSELKNTKKLPKKLIPLFAGLVKPVPPRCLVQDFIDRGQEKTGYFKNVFIDTMKFLEEIQIKDSTEKNRFFSNLNNLIESFPVYFCTNKILPLVVNSLEYGDANSHCLDLLLKIGKLLNESEYERRIVPSLMKLFASKDRSIRSKLLKEIEEYIDHTTNGLVNEQIFPHLIHGFMDSNPVIREQTVKSIFHLAPKLNYQNLNDEIIKHFSRIQMKDPEGGIRTNTIICLGKIAAHLQPQTRQGVMLPLFLRSLRDPFPPSRIACIQSLCATQNFFTLRDCTTKIMPALCLVLMDTEKQVRDQGFTALKNFIIKIERVSENPALVEQMESEINKSGSNVTTSKFTTGLSWAVSSLAAKLTRTKMETTGGEQNPAPVANENGNQPKSDADQKSYQPHQSEKRIINEKEKNDPHAEKIPMMNNDLNTDGWDDENWEDDLLKDLSSPIKPSADNESTTRRKKSDDFGQGTDGWDLDNQDDDWGDTFSSPPPIAVAEEPKKIIEPAKRRTPTSGTSAVTSTKPTKRGPMKLGAQKLTKKTFQD